MLGGETSGLLHTAASAESVGISSSLSMSSGRQSCGWRLPQDLFREVRRTTEELERLSKRCQRHFRTDVRKRIVNYYRDQNELLDLFEQADALDTQMGQGGSRPEAAAVEETEVENSDEDAAALPLRVSFLSNVFLLLLKLIVCYFSGSLSIIVSALDSVLDIVSGFILMATALAIKHRNKYRFPIGKERMEPVGIIVFSCIMGTVGFSVLVEGLRQLLGDEHTHHLESLAWPVAGMISVILVKLGLWVYCRRSTNPAVQVYAADHFNDVCTNSIGLAFALLGDRVVYWMDPLGAMLLAAWVTFNWGCTAHEHALNLVGQSASPQYLQMLTLMCWNHHPAIQLIDTVRAYTFGNKLFAEVDVVLPAAMTLTEAHDIGESLQYKLECLPEIERAFVHLDYEAGHKPEHDNRQPPPQMGPRNPLFASAVEPPAGEPSTAATQLWTHSHTL